MIFRLLLYWLIFFNFLPAIGQNPDFSVFQVTDSKTRKWILYKHNDEILYRLLADSAFSLLKARQQRVAALQDAAEWDDYRQALRERIYTGMKRFRKTPLHPRITGTIRRKGFRVEKVVFELLPGFYVTSCLFLPKKRQHPAPAVVDEPSPEEILLFLEEGTDTP